MTAATVVLVHGAWHGGWCWERVQPYLEAAGVPSIAVDLPGHGDSAAAFTDLHGDAAAVTAALDGVERPVVLVGHSYGGAVITEAGVHPAVARLVYLCAFNLTEGETCAAAAPDAAVPATDLGSLMELSADGSTCTIDAAAAVDVLYADCTPEDAAWAVERLGPQPIVGFGQAPAAIAWSDRPSTYVVCSEDRALHPALQRVLAARATDVVDWPTSHSPFLSQPERVATFLAALARDGATP